MSHVRTWHESCGQTLCGAFDVVLKHRADARLTALEIKQEILPPFVVRTVQRTHDVCES